MLPFESSSEGNVDEVLISELGPLSNDIHVVGGLGASLHRQRQVGLTGGFIKGVGHWKQT